MSEIAVIGGAGTVGRHVTAILRERGETVRVLSRSSEQHPVDLTTGSGLESALSGCGVVVNASNSPRHAERVLVQGSRRLAAVAAATGVGQLVDVSIVGIDDIPIGYYKAKLAQEAAVRGASVPYTIVRSTQFHELLDAALASLARFGISPRAAIPLQPILAAEAAVAIADAALAPPTGARTTVGGPEVLSLSALARARDRQRGRRVPMPLPLLGRAARSLRRGALSCPDADRRGTTTFADWLEAA